MTFPVPDIPVSLPLWLGVVCTAIAWGSNRKQLSCVAAGYRLDRRRIECFDRGDMADRVGFSHVERIIRSHHHMIGAECLDQAGSCCGVKTTLSTKTFLR